VLALQTLAFRYEWEALYDAILVDSALFINVLRCYRGGQESAFEELSPDFSALPLSLTDYLLSSSAAPLTRHESLDPYLSSVQSIRPSIILDSGAGVLEIFDREVAENWIRSSFPANPDVAGTADDE
jgi:hypothetical protein